MTLKDEIESRRQEIHTDSYNMSIGEIVNMYKDGDLNLRPEFQRYFRWNEHKKTRLIESILLGIPLPPIFVSQDDNGKWDVIDGLQRLSTILEFMGLLRDSDGEVREPLRLMAAKYLPSLDGLTWDLSDDFLRRLIKRCAIGVTIILRESDPNSKYELFERLNTGGASLSDQEIRNCLLVMLDRKFLVWIQGLASDENFKKCVSLSDKQKEEQEDLDLVVRYVVLRDYPMHTLRDNTDMGTLFTDKMISLLTAKEHPLDMQNMEMSFRRTFALLSETLGDNALRRYSAQKGRFEGSWSLSAFEVMAVGIGYNLGNAKSGSLPIDPGSITDIAKKLWTENATMREAMNRGVRPANRMKMTVELGRRIFSGKGA